jgi:GT2 family glycosyltransferase
LNREECLVQSLRTNANQTRPPKQIIVVDASENWAETRRSVLNTLAPDFPDIEWIYLQSPQRSLTHQRNIGLAECRADVGFFLDDDSFMYRDCAEEVMRVYEADPSEKIGGVCTWIEGAPEGTPPSPRAGASGAILSRWLGQVLMDTWDAQSLFLPYDGHYHRRALDHADPKQVGPASLFHGCRMTYRTAVVRKVGGFDEMLVGVAFCEDGDCSYRVSQIRTIAVAKRARIFHQAAQGGRVNARANTALVLANAVALYHVHHSESLRWWRVTAFRFLLRRTVLELLRDCARMRGGMPHVLGALDALRLAPKILWRDVDSLKREYPGIQMKLYQLGRSSLRVGMRQDEPKPIRWGRQEPGVCERPSHRATGAQEKIPRRP